MDMVIFRIVQYFDGFFHCHWNPGVTLDCTSSYEQGVNKPGQQMNVNGIDLFNNIRWDNQIALESHGT